MSTYYADPKISRLEKEEWDADIRGRIEQIRVDQPRTGYRPLLRHLRRKGIHIGERGLRRVIQKFELQIRPHKKFVKTTNSDHDNFIYPNLLPEMTLTGINQVWASERALVSILTLGMILLVT